MRPMQGESDVLHVLLRDAASIVGWHHWLEIHEAVYGEEKLKPVIESLLWQSQSTGVFETP